MCLASVVKKFEFWRSRIGGNTPFWYPKLWSNFIFFFVFAYLKHFMFPALKVKKFEFWKAPFGGVPIFEPSIFVRFSLFLISTHFENLII